MKKVIFILCALCALSSCRGIPNDVKKAFTYCYADVYTGIDTLINTDGYYNRRTFFYKNGLVVEGYYPERDHLELQKLKEFSEERFTSMYFIGIYRIYGDTLKIQYIRETQSLNDAGSGMEKWYKIIDKNTMLSAILFGLFLLV